MSEKAQLKARLEEIEQEERTAAEARQQAKKAEEKKHQQYMKKLTFNRQLIERNEIFTRTLDLFVDENRTNNPVEIARTLITDLQAYCEHVGRELGGLDD